MIWQESKTNVIYQESDPILGLSPLERNLLLYFIDNPRTNLTKSDLIENSWPPDVCREGVSDDSLFRLIRSVRTKISNGKFLSYHYIINWRGYPEGGYRFLPDAQEKAAISISEDDSLQRILNQLTVLQMVISNQKQTINLLEEIVDGVVQTVE